MVFGFSTILFNKSKDLTAGHIAAIERTGVKLLEIAPFHKVSDVVLEYTRKNVLKIFSIHADYLNSDISSDDEAIRKKSIDNIKTDIDKANYFGAKVVVVHPGKWTPQIQKRKSRLKNSIESLIDIVSFSAKKNIKIAVENLPTEFLCDNYNELHYIISGVKDFFIKKEKYFYADSIGVCIDTGHAFLTKSIDEFILNFSNDILSIHIHDNKGDNGNDRSIGGDDLHCMPGFGSINWDLFFESLKVIKYKNPLILEVMTVDGNNKDSKQVIPKITEFMKYRVKMVNKIFKIKIDI